MAMLMRNVAIRMIRQVSPGYHKGTIKAVGCDLQRRYNHQNVRCYDLVVVGGGIVGVAAAREILKRHPTMKVAILEKESKLALHQTGHNSGVVHAGIYYKPGSLKAQLCVEGLKLIYEFCDKHHVPYKKCGKLIVATDTVEEKRLLDLYERGQQNGVADLKLISESEIPEIEPYCRGIRAIWSPHTGIIDYALLTHQFGQTFRLAGGDIFLKYKVVKFEETKDGGSDEYPVTILGERPDQRVKARNVLTCAGLYSDVVAELTGCSRSPRIIPFRGEYLLLHESKKHMVRGNIYPVPDPRFPFLGVHFTPRMDGSVWLGPNAVLAFKREGYRWSNINIPELVDALRYPGFLRMAGKYLSFGLSEMSKSAFINLQVKELQKFIPEVTEYDIARGPAGVRAQAMDLDGNLVEDFIFDSGQGPLAKHVMHCRNAPSPGATSSLAIAKMIGDKIEERFQIAKKIEPLKAGL